MLTGGLLTPCLHRVSPLPGQSMEERYSMAYLQRAEDDVRMEPLAELGNNAASMQEVYTSREWLERKFGLLRRNPQTGELDNQRLLNAKINNVPHVETNSKATAASILAA
jgi:hypothetical protein